MALLPFQHLCSLPEPQGGQNETTTDKKKQTRQTRHKLDVQKDVKVKKSIQINKTQKTYNKKTKRVSQGTRIVGTEVRG